MDVVDLIRRDHDEIAGNLDRLAMLAHGRVDQVSRVAAHVVVAVRVHAVAEERVVYACLDRLAPLRGFALAAPQVHANLDTTIEKLLAQHPGDQLARFVHVAHDLFEAHAREDEEAELLPALREVLAAKELAALAAELVAEKARLRPQIERVAGLAARAA